MPRLVEGRYQAIRTDVGDNATKWILACRIIDYKSFTEVGEDEPEEPKNIGDDQEDAMLVTELRYRNLIIDRYAC